MDSYKDLKKQLDELQKRLASVGTRQTDAGLRFIDGDESARDTYLACLIERESLPQKIKRVGYLLVNAAQTQIKGEYFEAWRAVEALLTEQAPYINRITTVENQIQSYSGQNQKAPAHLADIVRELREKLVAGEPALKEANARLATLSRTAQDILGIDPVRSWSAELTAQQQQRALTCPTGKPGLRPEMSDGQKAQVW